MTASFDPQRLSSLWADYKGWLAENVPDGLANLAPPATLRQLKALEKAIKLQLPAELAAFLQLNNGHLNPIACCAIPGLEFLSTKRIAEQWKNWEEFREGETPDGLASLDNHSRALDPGVLDRYTHPGWIPAFKDVSRADYLGFDMAPAPGGTPGQIINFGRDEDEHFIAFATLTELLEYWLDLVRKGECRVLPAEPPKLPFAWFNHPSNSIDLLRWLARSRRRE
jgi:cell wall assembly regulator SMI1